MGMKLKHTFSNITVHYFNILAFTNVQCAEFPQEAYMLMKNQAIFFILSGFECFLLLMCAVATHRWCYRRHWTYVWVPRKGLWQIHIPGPAPLLFALKPECPTKPVLFLLLFPLGIILYQRLNTNNINNIAENKIPKRGSNMEFIKWWLHEWDGKKWRISRRVSVVV